ncbi:MAG: hypothetical protein U5J63_04095 [Fodinibius sp.]|nr:hypothetical protein [Fodinibius sp.]
MEEPTSRGMLASALREAKNNKPQGTLVLRADKDAIVDDAVRVMNIAKALQLNIVMATEQAPRLIDTMRHSMSGSNVQYRRGRSLCAGRYGWRTCGAV